jgi:tetratricopeptide (TPR) repeat protein
MVPRDPSDPLEALRGELSELDSATLAALTTPIGDAAKHRMVGHLRSMQAKQRRRSAIALGAALAACLAVVWMAGTEASPAARTAEAVRLTREAEAWRDQQRYDRAVELLVRALEIREQTLGPNHLEVAANLTELAELYRSQQMSAKAEPLYRRAFEIQPTAVF